MLLSHNLLIRVKDGDRLLKALDKAVSALGKKVKKSTFRDVELHSFYLDMGMSPCFAVCDGWLAVGMSPQAVKGHILRCQSKLARWKPDASSQAALARLPAKVTAASLSDPRPVLQKLLSIAPFMAESESPFGKSPFGMDASSFPNTNEVTQPLFPNISLLTDDGRTVRWHSRASLLMPIGLSDSNSPYAADSLFGYELLFLGAIFSDTPQIKSR